MNTTKIFFCLFSILILHPVYSQDHEFAPGVLLVKFKSSPKPQTGSSLTKFARKSLGTLTQGVAPPEIAPLFRRRSDVLTATKQKGLPQVVKLTFDPEVALQEIIQSYRQNPEVEYVQPNYIHRLDLTPNDPLFNEQTAMQILGMEEAWDLQIASPSVVVGVIDTGIDYDHEDLRSALWLNPGEDLDGNGLIDSTDFNGLDDDGNGFVDDVRGWDFVDAPSFPDGGDFRTPDNDPFDENGHGTSVAGLIGASGNNETGIAGLAFGCQIMNLRAGTSLGFLEEDDVASAIVYAVENGAKIINMSFGDDVASPLLRDVIEFAYSQNCLLVASAGNANTDEIHFPSGFAETISVGATDLQDGIAGFSNFGSSVDVVAPGVNLFTTSRGDRYRTFSGTSASAPLVSGLAALILSKTPQLTNESVRGLIVSTTDDLGEPGWDVLFASGRISPFKALSSPTFAVARILSPEVDQGFAQGPVTIKGTATGALLESYTVELGEGETPQSWIEIFRRANRQVIDEHLASLQIDNLADGVYTARLSVHNKDGTSVEDKTRFFIDRSPPVISGITSTRMLDGERVSLLIEFKTDDVCDAEIRFRSRGSEGAFKSVGLRFRTTEHRFHFTQEIATGELDYFIYALNGAQLESIADNGGRFFEANLSDPPVGDLAVTSVPYTLPSGFVLPKPSDFDQDGAPEIILNVYDSEFNFGPMKIFEKNADGFDEALSTQEVFIPRDWGDSDGDGLAEILAGAGANSFLFEAPTIGSFPTRVVWSDTTDAWASRFADLDRDGFGEMILRIDDLFTVWETVSDNDYALVDSFPNPTGGTNFVGVPKSEIGDFDGDGLFEILFGDFDGDVYLYENSSNDRYEFVWSDSLPLLDTIDYLTSGDYDNDGTVEFTVGCHSDPNLDVESEFDSRYWLYRVYKRSGDNSFEAVWEQAFFGFQSPADFDSGVSSGDVDNDGTPEILINVFPDFYIVDYDVGLAQYRVVWHTAPNRSNAALTVDLNRNGTNEFYFNAGPQIVGREAITDFTGPTTPVGLEARPLDSNLVELTWQPESSPDGFRIYRGTAPQETEPIARTNHPPYLDTDVETGVAYWYRITALDSLKNPPESLPTLAAPATPGAKPFVESAVFSHPGQIRVVFSETMDASIKNQNNFDIRGIGKPSSAVIHKSGKEVVITGPHAFEPGSYTVTVHNVFDVDGTPLDTLRNSAPFEVNALIRAPYLVNATLLQQNLLRLEFSDPMDPVTAAQIENYTVEPDVTLSSARLDPQDSKVVLLEINPSSPIGPFGIEYFLTIRAVRNQAGIAIKFGEGDTASLIFSSPDLSDVFAYPNPYRSTSSRRFVTIAGLTSEATIKIMDTSGRLIRTLAETDGNGGVEWDLKDDSGNEVSSGIYVFYVVGASSRTVGKLAVVR